MKTLALVFAGLLFAGCAQKMPLISHAHIGHSLTAWHDTPDNEALLIVAEKELAIALAESTSIVKATGAANKRHHFRNVVNTLNPDFQGAGPGLGYGAIRATQGTAEHLEYAAQSPDASDNIVTTVVKLTEQIYAISSRLNQALQLAISAENEPDERLAELGVALNEQLHLAVAGEASASNTGTDIASGEIGIARLHDAMQSMLDRETEPRYEPLARRYVLGLVRLPNGQWGYRLPRRQSSFANSRYGSYGY